MPILKHIQNAINYFRSGASSKERVVTPPYLQMHATECGAACLGIVLGHFGLWVPLTQLREKCEVSRDGSSAASIVRAARTFGLKGKGLGIKFDLVKELDPPLILFWQFSHFVVLEGFEGQVCYLNDPAIGRRQISIEEFNKGYSGIVLQFEKGEDFKAGGKGADLTSRLRDLLAGTGKEVAMILACSIMVTLLALFIPASLIIFIDDILLGQNNWGILVPALLFGGFLAYFLTLVKHQILQRLSVRISVGGYDEGLSRLLRLPIEYFIHRMPGDITDRVSSNDSLGKNIIAQYGSFLIELVSALILLAAMFILNVKLTLIVLFLAVINRFVTGFLATKMDPRGEKMKREQGILLGYIMQYLDNVGNLGMTGGDDRFFNKWSGQQALELQARRQYTVFARWTSALPIVIAGFRSAAILLFGGLMIISGQMTLGTLAGFYVLAEMFVTPLGKLLGFVEKKQELETDFHRKDDISQATEDSVFSRKRSDGSSIVSFKGSLKLAGQLELKNISFGFVKNRPPLIKNFCLEVKPGQRVALVGASGSGKSTIASLVAGIYQPWEGEIQFDGHSREEIPEEVLRRSFAMVDQDVVLFPATVRENITMWSSDVPDDVIYSAARDACIHNDILNRSQGYSTIVQEGGTNFSGGQKQRLEIARALVGNPTILILDEATSALDTVNEKAVDDALRRRGVTSLIIAHRLSTVRDSDVIVVLDKGVVVQSGTHDDLIKDENGTYFKLVKSE